METLAMAPEASLGTIIAASPWNTIIREYQDRAPVDVVRMAENGFRLKVWEQVLPPEISGKIKRDPKFGGDAQYSIIVNKSESKNRKRFTVAHEVAHYLLHRGLIGDELTDDPLYRSGLSTLQEVQANKLAADILMPFALIEREMRDGIRSISELARRFQVSEQAMSIRLGVPGQ